MNLTSLLRTYELADHVLQELYAKRSEKAQSFAKSINKKKDQRWRLAINQGVRDGNDHDVRAKAYS